MPLISIQVTAVFPLSFEIEVTVEKRRKPSRGSFRFSALHPFSLAARRRADPVVPAGRSFGGVIFHMGEKV